MKIKTITVEKFQSQLCCPIKVHLSNLGCNGMSASCTVGSLLRFLSDPGFENSARVRLQALSKELPGKGEVLHRDSSEGHLGHDLPTS